MIFKITIIGLFILLASALGLAIYQVKNDLISRKEVYKTINEMMDEEINDHSKLDLVLLKQRLEEIER